MSGITFYGVSLASSDLGGDLYVDFILTSIVEIPANILVIILTNKYVLNVYHMNLHHLLCILQKDVDENYCLSVFHKVFNAV